MIKQKRYEVLESLPTYGPMYISVTENGLPFYSEGFAVRFYKADGTEWVANFEPGWTKLKLVIELENSRNLLVIACGTCYLMNPDKTKPISVFGVGYSDMFKVSGNRIVLQDQTDFTIIEPDGTYWDTQRISWDDLRDVKIEDDKVSGLANNPISETEEWVPFSYDLNTKTLTGGSYYKFESIKPWWKI